MSTTATVGFPEVKLGIFPGFGGTVRMPRLVGVDNAVEWIAAGGDKKADAALKDGAVDAVVAPDKLRDAALALVRQAIAGKLDWKAKRAEKISPHQAQPDRAGDGVRQLDGGRGREGGPELPGADARAQEHAGSGAPRAATRRWRSRRSTSPRPR